MKFIVFNDKIINVNSVIYIDKITRCGGTVPGILVQLTNNAFYKNYDTFEERDEVFNKLFEQLK
jgi:hypothetical protein